MTKKVCVRAAVSKKGRAGITLLEIVFSFGILATALVITLSSVFASHYRNQILATEITARNVVQAQIEEILSISTEYAHKYSDAAVGTAAIGTLGYYATSAVADMQLHDVGGSLVDAVKVDDGALVRLFPVPNVGEDSHRLVSAKKPSLPIRWLSVKSLCILMKQKCCLSRQPQTCGRIWGAGQGISIAGST